MAHTESIRLFRETIELGKVLTNQVCTAIEETFYKEVVNLHTNTVTDPLSNFLTRIFTNYGDIDNDIIAEEAKKVLDISYDLQSPIINIFEPIQELEQVAIAGNRPYTQDQLINMGVTIISNTHDFETTLIVWHSLTPLAQTWATFKHMFTTAKKYLRKVRGKYMRSASFHQANLTAANLDDVRNEVLQEVRHVQTNVIEAMVAAPPVAEPSQTQVENSIVSNTELASLVTLISNLTTTVQGIQQTVNYGSRGGRDVKGG